MGFQLIREMAAEVKQEWDSSPATLEQLRAKARHRLVATMQRERALAYAFSEQMQVRRKCEERKPCSCSAGYGAADVEEEEEAEKEGIYRRRGIWWQRWLAAKPWEKRMSAVHGISRDHVSALLTKTSPIPTTTNTTDINMIVDDYASSYLEPCSANNAFTATSAAVVTNLNSTNNAKGGITDMMVAHHCSSHDQWKHDRVHHKLLHKSMLSPISGHGTAVPTRSNSMDSRLMRFQRTCDPVATSRYWRSSSSSKRASTPRMRSATMDEDDDDDARLVRRGCRRLYSGGGRGDPLLIREATKGERTASAINPATMAAASGAAVRARGVWDGCGPGCGQIVDRKKPSSS